MIEFRNVSFHYGGENGTGEGVDNILLTIQSGEVVVLCGRSGCGKTTVTRLVNGLALHFFPVNWRAKCGWMTSVSQKRLSLTLAGGWAASSRIPKASSLTWSEAHMNKFTCFLSEAYASGPL